MALGGVGKREKVGSAEGALSCVKGIFEEADAIVEIRAGSVKSR